MAGLIDQEVRNFVNIAYQRALDILTEHKDALDRVSEVLLEKETLEGKELEELLAEVLPPRPKPEPKKPRVVGGGTSQVAPAF